MKLEELFENAGLGVLATADVEGRVNTAVYARPRVLDEVTLVWGMTDGRSFRNVARNPRASYLFKEFAPGFTGARLTLELIKTEESGQMLDALKKSSEDVVGRGTGAAITHAAWFRVVEVRPLV